jgi:hypothetical protein
MDLNFYHAITYNFKTNHNAQKWKRWFQEYSLNLGHQDHRITTTNDTPWLPMLIPHKKKTFKS